MTPGPSASPGTPRIRRGPREAPARRPVAAAAASSSIVLADGAVAALCLVDGRNARLSPADRAALAAARILAGPDALVAALVWPAGTSLPVGLGEAGADRVTAVADPSPVSGGPARGNAVLEAALTTTGARHVVAADTGLFGPAARFHAVATGDHAAVRVVRIEDGLLVCRQDAGRTEVLRPPPRVVLVDGERFPPGPPGAPREARPVAAPPVDWPAGPGAVTPLPVDASLVPLAEADLILGGGAGVRGWDVLRQAAEALGAAVAGSRVACDAGHLPRDRQVGVSGTLVSPRCYLAFGISGATQHMDGIAGAQRIVAVNTDPLSEMMRKADLAIEADANAVLAALLRQLRETSQ